MLNKRANAFTEDFSDTSEELAGLQGILLGVLRNKESLRRNRYRPDGRNHWGVGWRAGNQTLF